MVKLALTRRPWTRVAREPNSNMTRCRKVLAFNQSSRLALWRVQVLSTSEKLSERLERTATLRGGGEYASKSVGYRGRGSQIPHSVSNATTATTTMMTGWNAHGEGSQKDLQVQ